MINAQISKPLKSTYEGANVLNLKDLGFDIV